MWLDPQRYEIIDDQMAEILRAKTPAERLAIADGLWRTAHELVRAGLQRNHPDWTAEQIQAETARRMSGGAIGPAA